MENKYSCQSLSDVGCLFSHMIICHQSFSPGVSNLLFVNWFFCICKMRFTRMELVKSQYVMVKINWEEEAEMWIYTPLKYLNGTQKLQKQIMPLCMGMSTSKLKKFSIKQDDLEPKTNKSFLVGTNPVYSWRSLPLLEEKYPINA